MSGRRDEETENDKEPSRRRGRETGNEREGDRERVKGKQREGEREGTGRVENKKSSGAADRALMEAAGRQSGC